LPLQADQLKKVAVIGRLANAINTGDGGSSSVKDCPEIITAYAGLKAALPSAHITLEERDDASAAKYATSGADVAIVVVGYTAADEGEFIDASIITDPILLATYPEADTPEAETAKKAVLDMAKGGGSNILGQGDADMKAGGDRASLRVRPIDAEIIKAVASACKKTIVCVVTAGAVIMEEWRKEVPGLVIAWYSGAEGGRALADVLLGEVDASGRLPYSVPSTEEHLPFFDMEATKITYDRWHGQRLLDQKGWEAAFPLGFGLSYTDFEMSGVKAKAGSGETIDVEVGVKNVGAREGRHIVQVYGKLVDAGGDFPSRVLLGFAPVDLKDGELKTVKVTASTRPLKRWKDSGFVWAGKGVDVEVGSFSGDKKALKVSLECDKLT
jgi:beta-glucosidase